MSCKYSGTVASDNCISSMTWSMSFFLLLIPKNSYLKVISSGEQVPTLVSSVDCPLLGKLLHVVQDFRSGVFPGQPSLCCHPHSYLPQIMWAPNCKIPLWIQVPEGWETIFMTSVAKQLKRRAVSTSGCKVPIRDSNTTAPGEGATDGAERPVYKGDDRMRAAHFPETGVTGNKQEPQCASYFYMFKVLQNSHWHNANFLLCFSHTFLFSKRDFSLFCVNDIC